MTDQTQKPAEYDSDAQVPDAAGPSARRRAFVRAASAVPVILTLHSGAALARSSNLISTVQNLNSDGSANCLDTTGLTNPDPQVPNLYDLGQSQSATVYKLGPVSPQTEEYFVAGGGGKVQDLKAMCESGGNYYNSNNKDAVFTLPPGGGMISATAMSSLAGRATITVIDL